MSAGPSAPQQGGPLGDDEAGPARALQIRVLGCSGAIARGERTTAFLVDDDLLVDAGTGVGDLTLEEMARIDDVVLTHSHLDHVAALPLMVDAVAGLRRRPLRVHGLRATLQVLRAHIFNNLVWPDFSALPSSEAPLIHFVEFDVGQTLLLGRRVPKLVEVLPAVHTVPACGFAVRRADGRSHWVFSGDTERNKPFWRRLNQLDVGALVIETAFSTSERQLAERSLHLSPPALLEELAHMAPTARYPVYITHTKPAAVADIRAEVEALVRAQLRWPALRLHWLAAGQTLTVPAGEEGGRSPPASPQANGSGGMGGSGGSGGDRNDNR